MKSAPPVLPGLFDIHVEPPAPAVCRFCGATEPHDVDGCDGRQGHVENRLLVSGLTAATLNTSIAAALSVQEINAQQRERVYACIAAAGADGRTDDEIQVLLGLDGSSERPRRWELWKADLIKISRTPDTKAVRRRTRKGRLAVVWTEAERAKP